QWTFAVSREKLDEILGVSADFRSTSNSLPVRAEISLQDVIKNFGYSLQSDILRLKLHDLEVAQFRMVPSLAILAAEYRNALAGYLGESEVNRHGTIVNKFPTRVVSARETLRILNALDARRRSIALAAGHGWMD
ncbi:MAG TPA: hypothetical protein VGV18_11960, partial [Verrucomicrobiae bacterium]|nr:hypothetical protein [Verrucomicrobiae bacterium]